MTAWKEWVKDRVFKRKLIYGAFYIFKDTVYSLVLAVAVGFSYQLWAKLWILIGLNIFAIPLALLGFVGLPWWGWYTVVMCWLSDLVNVELKFFKVEEP